MLDNLRAMQRHDGPAYDHWERRVLAAFGVVDVDAGRGKA